MTVLLVELNTKGNVERPQAQSLKVIVQLLHARLMADGRHRVAALAYREARAVWANLEPAPQEVAEAITTDEAARLLERLGADFLLAGTSFNGVDLEKRFIAAARLAGVPSLAVLDFWSSYGLRFADAAGRLAYLPDRIAVMDASARAELIAAGVEAERVVATGQPALEALGDVRRRLRPVRRATRPGSVNLRTGRHSWRSGILVRSSRRRAFRSICSPATWPATHPRGPW